VRGAAPPRPCPVVTGWQLPRHASPLQAHSLINPHSHLAARSPTADGTGRGTLPPGPIDNARLLGKGAKPLPNQRPVIHYRGVAPPVWAFLHGIYGGGPALPRRGIDLYGRPPLPAAAAPAPAATAPAAAVAAAAAPSPAAPSQPQPQ
jgi:hypothetical protein